MIKHFKELDYTNKEYGGKTNGLLLLKSLGFIVPDFYVIGNNVVQSIIKTPYILEDIAHFWIHTVDSEKLWAIRSSANEEDGTQYSYAGLFSTEINIHTSQVVDAIKSLIDKYRNVEFDAYGTMKKEGFSIIIQEMISPDYSGVIFSKNILDSNAKHGIINIIPGLGEYLVSGKKQACSGHFSTNTITWINSQHVYDGVKYTNGKHDISVSFTNLTKDIKPHETTLIQGALKLEKEIGMPVDIEFCISNNTINWLQVRPITTKNSSDSQIVYDNSNIGENYPGICMPLTTSFVQFTYSKAYAEVITYLGMNKKNMVKNEHIIQNLVSVIDGALYYNLTSWQQILYQLPFGKITSKLYPVLLGMESAEFPKPKAKPNIIVYLKLLYRLIASLVFFKRIKKSYEDNYNQVFHDYLGKRFEGYTHDELSQTYHTVIIRFSKNWIAPLLNGFYTMIFFSLLKKIFKNSRLATSHPNFINDILFSQGDIVSVKLVRELQNLFYEIHDSKELLEYFKTNEADFILKNIGVDFPKCHETISNYISNYGVRCDSGELKMEIENYQENPLKFIQFIKNNIQGFSEKSNTNFSIDYKSILNTKYKYNVFKKCILTVLITITLRRIKDRENYRFVRSQTFSIIRFIFRAIDVQLLADNLICEKGDSLYLKYNELIDTTIAKDYKEIIVQRKKDILYYKQHTKHANRYFYSHGKFLPAEKSAANKSLKTITGTGCCSGIITGKVIIVTPETISKVPVKDAIIIAEYFEPGWINLFAQAKGLVSEKGNILSHTAILCREMGITSIIGAKHITSIVSNGTTVQINGSTGEIHIIQENNEY